MVTPRKVDLTRLRKSALPASFVVLTMWVVAWLVSGFGLIGGISSQPVGDAFNSLNALFAGLAFVGVLTTIVFQMIEQAEAAEQMKEASRANEEATKAAERTVLAAERTAIAATDKAVMDMFQTFCSPAFQNVKTASHKVLINYMANAAYRDFVVSRLFVVCQSDMDDGLKAWLTGTCGYGAATDDDGNLQDERQHRYKLDELMNFFSVLSVLHCSGDVVKRCDFAYPWWRPLFWEIAIAQIERYDDNKDVMEKFCKPAPSFREVLVRLDGLYGYAPFEGRPDLEAHLAEHPKIRSYREGLKAKAVAKAVPATGPEPHATTGS